MKTILGTKEKMTQIFTEDGRVYPATVVKTDSVTILQVKTIQKEGYNAVVVGFGERKEKNINKAQLGQFKDMGKFMYVKEFPITDEQAIAVKAGEKIELSIFEKGDKVTLTGFSKGKGFQGVVKRHGFKGGPRTHGQKHSEREPGSIGGGGRSGGRVIRGMRMAGRMGNDKVTLKNVTVLGTDIKSGLLYLKGSIPGRKGTLIKITG
jgi:large subunit ribosomal protein L3